MANSGGEIGEHVEDTRIVVFHFASAMIAEKIIELLFGSWKINIVSPVEDINVLACMRVVEAKMTLLRKTMVHRQTGVAG